MDSRLYKALKALKALRDCFDDRGELIVRPASAQAYPTVDPTEAISVLDFADHVLAADRYLRNRDADRVDGYDRDDLGESPDY